MVSRLDHDQPDAGQGPRLWRVAEVNRGIRMRLERAYSDVWIVGEISETSAAGSGHVYLTLSDPEEPAQLRVVMFRGDAQRSKAELTKGSVVRVRGTLSLFEPRGTFQLIARVALPGGAGDLHAQLARLKKRLAAEGLFAEERKRSLPVAPRVVGIVTSIKGAALRDIIKVASDRFPVRLVVADCRVQGATAAPSIVAAIRSIQRVADLEVLIVGRGGGSAEELWAFNDERVVRAIVECRVPVVSAVGHETDVTLADLAADVRAATPSNAAEIAVPVRTTLESELRAGERSLHRALETLIARGRLALERQQARLEDPRRVISVAQKRLADLRLRLERATRRRLNAPRDRSVHLRGRLMRCEPRQKLAADRRSLDRLVERLHALGTGLPTPGRRTLEQLRAIVDRQARELLLPRRGQLAEMVAQLSALSPLSVLARGYSIALHGEPRRALLAASDVAVGDQIEVRVHSGAILASVDEVRT